MPPPDEWPKYVPSGLSPWFSRERVQNLLDDVLRNKNLLPTLDIWHKLSGTNPPLKTPNVYQGEGGNNPSQVSAIFSALEKYPEVASHVRTIYTGNDKYMDPDTYGLNHPALGRIDLRGVNPNTGKPFSTEYNMNVIAHELSHSAGIRDFSGKPNAYDVGGLAGLLAPERGDIHLFEEAWDKSPEASRWTYNPPPPLPYDEKYDFDTRFPYQEKSTGIGPSRKFKPAF